MSLEALLPLYVAVPLVVSAATAPAAAHRRWPRVLLMVTLLAQLVASLLLVGLVSDGRVLAHGVGGWQGGIAIPFVADMLSALMLVVTSLLALTCSAFALASHPGTVRLFPALALGLVAGVNGALLTGDLFNLFVFIEVMLLPTYGLFILARRHQGTVRAHVGSRLYVAFNLFVSTMFLMGVALVYGVTGTVNLAELAGAAAEDHLVAIAGGLVIAALCMKAAVVPTHGWLARTYPSTSPAGWSSPRCA